MASGDPGGSSWQGHNASRAASDDVITDPDLDLGACLEAAQDLQDEVSPHLYSDADTSSPQNFAWVEDVIELTSSQGGGVVTSPYGEAGAELNVINASGSRVDFAQGQTLSSTLNAPSHNLDRYGSNSMASGQSSSFFPLQTLVSLQASSAVDPGPLEIGSYSTVVASRPVAVTSASTLSSSLLSSSSSSPSLSASSSSGLRTPGQLVWHRAVVASPSSDRGSDRSSINSRSSVCDQTYQASASTSTSDLPGEVSMNQASSRLKCLLKSKLQSKGSATRTAVASTSRSREDPTPSTTRVQLLQPPRSRSASCVAAAAAASTSSTHEDQPTPSVPLLQPPRSHSASSVASSSQDSDVTWGLLRSASSSPSSVSVLSMEEEDDKDTDDPVRLQAKREKNRLAARKSRNKKLERGEKLENEVSRLVEKQERLRREVQKLRDEKERLEDTIDIHAMVCPHIRKPGSTGGDGSSSSNNNKKHHNNS